MTAAGDMAGLAAPEAPKGATGESGHRTPAVLTTSLPQLLPPNDQPTPCLYVKGFLCVAGTM